MTRFLLIRHGETQWNKDMLCMGHTDIPLSKAGIRQAECLAERLKTWKIDAVYASDLSRAYGTAEIIARSHNLPVGKLSALRELNFGEWEGCTYAQVEERDPAGLKEWWGDIKNNRVPGGETFDELRQRAMAGLQQLVERHPEQTVAVVSHGGTIKAILCHIVGSDIRNHWRFKQDNAALNIVEFYPEGGIICRMNDTEHLGNLKF